MNLLRIAAEIGLDVSVLGFSFNAEPSPLVLGALRDLPSSVRLCARDPISHGRLTKDLGRPVRPHWVRDPPKSGEDAYYDATEEQRREWEAREDSRDHQRIENPLPTSIAVVLASTL